MFQTIALLICAPALAFFLAKWLFQKDTEKENRRRRAAEVAAIYKRRGLEDLPKMLVDYSVGDASGLLNGFLDIVRRYVMVDDATVEREIDRIFDNMLNAVLGTAEGRTMVAARLAEHQPTTAA